MIQHILHVVRMISSAVIVWHSIHNNDTQNDIFYVIISCFQSFMDVLVTLFKIIR